MYRARASWPVWLAVATLVSVGLGIWKTRAQIVHETTVTLRFAEGSIKVGEPPASIGTLRAYIMDLAFSRPHLLEMARRHPAVFPGAVGDPDNTVDTIRESMVVSVTEPPVFDEIDEGDNPPRTMRIEITFRATVPRVSWTIAHELANLLTETETARQRRELERQATLGKYLDIIGKGRTPASRHTRRQVGTQRQRVETARFALKALAEHQSVRFEMIDPGKPPLTPANIGIVGISFLYLALLLPVVALFAGAFDPRVIDPGDLGTPAAGGVTALGRLPRPHSRV
jgi:hypothetical protein